MAQRGWWRWAIVLPLVSSLAVTLGADSWRLPKREKYYSSNKKFLLEVTPRSLESQLKYFEDKVAGSEPAGGQAGSESAGPQATLSARQLLWYRRQSSFALVNDVAPVDVAVSDDGNHIVTFDNWHEMGYGDSVVVIYRSDGHVVRHFALTDLLDQSDIEQHAGHSVSSIHWRDGYRFVPTSDDLVLTVKSDARDLPPQTSRTHEISIDLATGQLREPVHRLWPRREAVVSVSATGDAGTFRGSDYAVCATSGLTFETPGIVALSSTDLLARATIRPLPAFPLIAIVARAAGPVDVEVLVDDAGRVQCARAVAGAPLFLAAAVDAARRWTFEAPSSSPGGLFVGRIHFQFDFEWK